MRKTGQLVSITIIAAALTSCAMSSGHKRGPNGRPVHFIDGMNAAAAYKKAEKLCPHGYTFIGEPRQSSVIDYVMTVECKPPGLVGTPQPMVAAPPAGMSFVPLPLIETDARCREMRDQTGSSIAQAACAQQEGPAKRWLEQRPTSSRIAVFCGQLAQRYRSYLVAKNCVEQEEAAEMRLGPQPDTPAASTGNWWDGQKTGTP